MKHLKTPKQLNEASENLNISDVSDSNLTMRQLILDRINQIKRVENGFSKSLMKWRQPLSHGTITKFAEEIIFEDLSDSDLLFLFERILRRHLVG